MNDFIKTPLWQEIKSIMLSAISDNISDIDTNKSVEMIALEVKAMELGRIKVRKAIQKVERLARTETLKTGSFK
jgi:hypothetical protein